MSGVDRLEARLALMVLTDPACGEGRSIVDVVRAAVEAGAPAIQLRAKDESSREAYELAQRLREVTAAYGALLIVNDRVDVALAVGADGAHVGDHDLPLASARGISPPGFILGRSVDTAEQAVRAASEGADYVGVGPVFGTPSKLDAAQPIGMEGVRRVRRAVDVPVVAIGGLDLRSAAEVAEAGAHGIAVIRAVMQAQDPSVTVREILRAIEIGRALHS